MATANIELPILRNDLVLQPVSDDEIVVKLRSRREYFSVGRAEYFLLTQLNGTHSVESLREAFQKEFGDELSAEDVQDFVALVKSRRLVEFGDETRIERPNDRTTVQDDDDDGEDYAPNGDNKRQNVLFYRVPLFDPDRLFSWLEPKIRWVWTLNFFVISVLFMAFATMITWANRADLVTKFPEAVRWETFIAVAIVLFTATTLHEFAHGLTCKHYGGEVREVGLMIMFFMPCLYCNVSDAWLIPKKFKRIMITAAGGYCDLCIWAMSVFCWRLTIQDCLINHLAFVAMTVCGSRGLINFNPLLRLDGYYLLSDWLEIPNLRKRALTYWMQHIRWMLWGADRPTKEPRGRLLLTYGVFCWCFALVFLDVIFFRFLKYASNEFGMFGIVFMSLLLGYAMRRVFKGFFSSEFTKMITSRHKKTATWIVGIVGILVIAFILPIRHYAVGNFEVRPGVLHEIHSPVTGFVKDVHVEEGAHVHAGDVLVTLDSPELKSQIATKTSELQESEANLAKLTKGPRPEEISEQKSRVQRLQNWCDLGRDDVARANQELNEQLAILDSRILQSKAELNFAQSTLTQSERLYELGALAGEQLRAERMAITLLNLKAAQIEGERRARLANGIRQVEAELARREQELADAQSKLDLLQAGSRPEDIAAEEAHRKRIVQELTHLELQQKKMEVRATVSGVVATPRMREKLGQLATVGLPICVIEDASTSRVEISVTEDNIHDIQTGQVVSLKARALPFQTFEAKVERVAPATAKKLEVNSANVLVIHCTVDNSNGQLKTGMTGFGRILRGWKTVGVVMSSKMLRYLRTEFWW